eukprot:scaffold32262_cov75-Phaeocystis_antarctica.AAC.1
MPTPPRSAGQQACRRTRSRGRAGAAASAPRRRRSAPAVPPWLVPARATRLPPGAPATAEGLVGGRSR